MFKHVLVPTDGSNLSTKAIKQAVKFSQAIGAKITGLHVMPEFMIQGYMEFPAYGQWSQEEFVKETEQEASKFLDVIKQEADSARVPCNLVTERGNQPYRAIIDVAQKRSCDLVFMASHGRRGLGALVLGSETNKVLTHSKIPVLVSR